MDERPIINHNTYCHHEAGHAVAFWHHGIEIEYVRMKPSYPGHSGETKTVSHEVVTLAQIEAEMKCTAAGYIAASALSTLREEVSDDELIECFTRNAKRFAKVPKDPKLTLPDDLRFVKLVQDRDEILKATPGAATGPESWLPVVREAERLIEVELWPAVHAVAYELVRSAFDLHNEDVATLATRALGHSES